MTSPTVIYDPLSVLQSVPGDPTALSRLVEQEQPCLQRWLRQVLRDDDLADESVQDTWLTISRGEWCFSARSGDAAGDVRVWLR